MEIVFTAAQNSTQLSQNAKQAFAQRRLQFLEEFGSDNSMYVLLQLALLSLVCNLV